MEKNKQFADLETKFGMGKSKSSFQGKVQGGVSGEADLQKTKKKPRISRELLLVSLIVVLLLGLGGVGYLYMREKKNRSDSTQIATEQAREIKEAVSKLMVLPEEEPTIATIMNVDKLREENSEFYKDAENGDKLLIFSQKAIIYRPSSELIINVAPIVRQPEGTPSNGNEPQSGTDSEAAEAASTITVELRNGSTESGVTFNYENQIRNNLGSDYQVTTKVDASSSDYSGVVVYDLTDGGKSELVQALAGELNATVETDLPSGEDLSEADVVVIIGKAE